VALNYVTSPNREDETTDHQYSESEPPTPNDALDTSRRPSDGTDLSYSPISPIRPTPAKTTRALGPEDFELDLESGRQRAVRLDSVGIDEDGERRQRTVRHSQVPSKLSVQVAGNKRSGD
jgi:hypothetical protein